MIKALFRWLDAHPGSYWLILAVPSAMLVGMLVAGWRRGEEADRDGHRGFDWRFALLLLAVLLAWRWPPLLGIRDLNPDESLLIAGALTAGRRAVPWQDFEGTTSGPLNVYALLPTHLLGIPQDYFNARVTALLLEWGVLLAIYGMLRSVHGTARARFALLPGIVFSAAAADGDFIQYSSEHLALFLAALGACLLWLHRPDSPSGRGGGLRWWAGGVAIGLLPWAKLQAVPLAVAAAGWGAWLILADTASPWPCRWRRVGWLAVAVTAPSLVFLSGLLAGGLFGDFYNSYILDNLAYVGVRLPLAAAFSEFARLSMGTRHFPAFLGGTVLIVIAAGGWLAWRRRRPGRLFAAGAWFTAAALGTVLAPGRGYNHYLLYLFPPLTLWAAAALCEVRAGVGGRFARWGLALGFAAAGALFPVAVRLALPGSPGLGQLARDWRQPYDEAGRTLRALRRPGDSLLVWGWYTHLYVECGLPQATREGHTEREIRPSPLRDSYFRPRLMADLRRHRPAFFVDGVGPGAFYYEDRARFGFETFPDLYDYVEAHYVLLSDLGYARIYLRKDRQAGVPGPPQHP